MAAVIALIDMPAQESGSAIFNGIKHFHLPGRHFVMSPKGMAKLTEDITHFR
jgi:hypothetical protein